MISNMTLLFMDDGIAREDTPIDLVDSEIEGNFFSNFGLPDDEALFITFIK